MGDHEMVTMATKGRWVQVNNTVVPVIRRTTDKCQNYDLIPLPVLQHGAGLLTDSCLSTVNCTKQESLHLSEMCTDAGIEFHFSLDTELIELSEINDKSLHIVDLPSEDPFAHAQYVQDRASIDYSAIEANKGCVEGDNSNEMKNIDQSPTEETSAKIWRPVSFSPSVTESDTGVCPRDTCGVSPSLANMSAPLDLSVPGQGQPKHISRDQDQPKHTTRDQDQPKHTSCDQQKHTACDQDQQKHTTHSESHKKKKKRKLSSSSISIRQREVPSMTYSSILGKSVPVVLLDGKEYISVDVIKSVYLPTMSAFSVLETLQHANVCVQEIAHADKLSLGMGMSQQIFPTCNKMVRVKGFEEVLIKIVAVGEQVNQLQLSQMLTMGYYLNCMQYPSPYLSGGSPEDLQPYYWGGMGTDQTKMFTSRPTPNPFSRLWDTNDND